VVVVCFFSILRSDERMKRFFGDFPIFEKGDSRRGDDLGVTAMAAYRRDQSPGALHYHPHLLRRKSAAELEVHMANYSLRFQLLPWME